jgi:hypothetical protein
MPDPTTTRPVPEPDHAAKPPSTAPRLLPGTGPKQPKFPVSFTGKRGCDRIRARLYADQRLKGLVLAVLLALSEFVDVRRKAWPKQTTLAKMVHATRENVGRALGVCAAEKIGPNIKWNAALLTTTCSSRSCRKSSYGADS